MLPPVALAGMMTFKLLMRCFETTEEPEDTTDEHGDHDDVEFLGTRNGMKTDEKLETSAEKDEDGDKAASDDKTPTEPEPDFTVTPAKDGQLPTYYDL